MATDLLAQDMAAAARRLAALRFRPAPQVAFLGDSLTQFGINVGATQTQWTNCSYVPWLRWLMGDRMRTSPSLVFGIASTRTDHLVSTQVPQALAARPDIAVVQHGTNDIGVFTAEQSAANIAAAVAALNAAGIAVVAIALVPQNGWNAARRQQAAEYNRRLWQMSRDPARTLRFVDPNPGFTDYASGNAAAGHLLSDGVHDSPAGALAKAQVIAAALDDLFPRASDLAISSGSDSYDPVLAPGGDLLVNGLMTGTGGTLANGATGAVPTGWFGGFDATGTSSATLAMGKAADPLIPTLPTATMTLGGTGDAKIAKLDQSIAATTGLAAGDRLTLQAEVRWSGLTGVRAVSLRLQVRDGSTTFESWDGAAFTPAGTTVVPLPPNFAGRLRTPPLTLPANAQGLRVMIQATTVAGAALSGTVAVGRCSVRRE
jgi:hypothetical protein